MEHPSGTLSHKTFGDSHCERAGMCSSSQRSLPEADIIGVVISFIIYAGEKS